MLPTTVILEEYGGVERGNKTGGWMGSRVGRYWQFFCAFPGTAIRWLHAEAAGSITPTRQNPNKNFSQTSEAVVLLGSY